MFELTPLPFELGALAPLMTRETLETHHGKHHAGYVKKTNDKIAQSELRASSLEEVVRHAAKLDDPDLFNNAAQTWNHGFFWQCLAPARQPPAGGALAAAIDRGFRSWDAFEEAFRKAGAAHFGSGWLWLVANAEGAVSLEAMHDAGTPIAAAGKRPILVCDLWEHAYYLDHKNERGKYLQGFIETLANWRFAEAQYGAALKGQAGWSYPAPRE